MSQQLCFDGIPEKPTNLKATCWKVIFSIFFIIFEHGYFRSQGRGGNFDGEPTHEKCDGP